jgi:hypothetical protein
LKRGGERVEAFESFDIALRGTSYGSLRIRGPGGEGVVDPHGHFQLVQGRKEGVAFELVVLRGRVEGRTIHLLDYACMSSLPGGRTTAAQERCVALARPIKARLRPRDPLAAALDGDSAEERTRIAVHTFVRDSQWTTLHSAPLRA